MADFRRVVTALAVVVLLMGFAQTVSAQPFACTATAAVTPLLRSEGITELTGDIVLNCTGVPAPGSAGGLANIQVFMNAPVTSRLLSGIASESVLIVDEAAQPFTFGTNAFQGSVIGNSISFIGVPVIPAGTSRTLRITNIRVNASAVPAGVAGVPGAVQALISISGPTSLPISNPQLTVGFVTQGLFFTLHGLSSGNINVDSAVGSGGFSFAQCASLARTVPRGFVRFREGFPTSFKLQGNSSQTQVGAIYNTESGLAISNLTGGGNVAGVANFATRLRATFANIPSGLNVWVSIRNVTQTNVASNPANAVSQAVLIQPESGISGSVPIPAGETSPVDMALLANVGGVATAVWEVQATSPTVTEDFYFQIHLASSANVSTNTPAAGVQSTVAGSFFPTSTAGTATTGPIPRFVDTGVARNFAIFNICRTILLFPFVTNQAGFDTGLAISNTSQDPFGTVTQAGTCTWNFFGANAPAAVPTASVAAGSTITSLASIDAPNFQGYAIAVCNFQFAHGFAFVSDLGARNLAMGYLSLVIPDRGRVANSFTFDAAAGQGEQLGN